ncbi:MAG: aminotransferase class IV [Planctomycetota bacterium]
MTLAWCDGEFVAASEAPQDPLTAGEGLFETILVRDGRPVFLEEHLARLARSADALEVPGRERVDEMRAACRELPARAGIDRGRMRAALDRGRAVATLEPFAGHPAALYEDGAEADLDPAPGHPLGDRAGHKILPYTSMREAREAARRRGAIDVVFRDRDGALLEGSACNVFVALDGVVRTPPAARPILEGVTRRLVIECALDAGLVAREADVFPEDLERATEAFLTGSLMEVLPLRRLGPRRFEPGVVSATLLDALRRIGARRISPDGAW